MSDSIHIDILEAIGTAKLLLVDISRDQEGKRNPNVMYELGLAHATRLPEEVVVVRSDGTDDLLRDVFDIAQIRAHRVLRDGTALDESRRQIEKLLLSAAREVDITRDRIVERVRRSLDATGYFVLATLDQLAREGHPLFAPALGEGRWGALSNGEARRTFAKPHDIGVIELDAASPSVNEESRDRMPLVKFTALGDAMRTRIGKAGR